jgi:hypothetical protein
VLPLPLDPPAVRANPCWRNATTGALACLPYVLLAGGLQCGVQDLYQVSALRVFGEFAAGEFSGRIQHEYSAQPATGGRRRIWRLLVRAHRFAIFPSSTSLALTAGSCAHGEPTGLDWLVRHHSAAAMHKLL